ncbi:DUF6412 domain-containing protein [Streptomyces sp. RB6PN25]|uniref:DUF6412 domain-containing protein n=1 Tax=Streptomyces humicola TaxID=2953240 RepID=A0ABT1Q1J4_9ACTN|nr:DUF6412 domain-containing protein [Streptomyces humicola]MCQ4083806.1 DUF6412 domain-containing protein [Streptomyces humicola]
MSCTIGACGASPRTGLLRVYIGALLMLLIGLLLTQTGLTSAVAAAATTAAVLMLAGIFSTVPAARPVSPGRIRTAIKDRERRTAFLAQRDPDASGRRRPRAPGRPLGTAA